MFPCFGYGPPHRLSVGDISMEDTCCALVSAWPANAAVCFSLVCTLICKSWPAGIGCYSQPGHNWHLAKEWMDMLSCVALSLLDESW